MAENSQEVTLVTATATPLHWSTWYPELVIVNDGAGTLFARTDGTAATGGSGDINIPADAEVVLANEQAEPEPDSETGYPPYMIPGWTAQLDESPYTSYATYVSLYAASPNTPTVTVTAQ
jgi:hypothetical protein